MNRYREQTPYVFSPPKYSNFWAPVIQRLSDTFYLRRRHRVKLAAVGPGIKSLVQHHQKGDSILITPNHSDHADPHVMLNVARRFKIPMHFIAAREIFLANHGINGKILQRAGVFSIDREGTDLRSIKEAMRIVAEGRFPLVMFPEGEIYHLNEKLTPLNEGAATIALRTARKAAKETAHRNVLIFPIAIRYTYIDDITDKFPEAMDQLERKILWQPQTHLSIIDRIYKFGEAVLALKEKEYLGHTQSGSITERLNSFRETLISGIEKRYLQKTHDAPHPERIRRLRGCIRNVLLADEKPDRETIKQCYRDLDALYVAIQLYSYPGQYLRDHPSPDRIAETILKFEEDFFEINRPKGRRKAEVTICNPINTTAMVDQLHQDAKATTQKVTQLIENAIRKVLE